MIGWLLTTGVALGAQGPGREGARNGLSLGDGLAFGVGAGVGTASARLHLPRQGEDWRVGPVLAGRLGMRAGPVPLWLVADVQAFRASGEREGVPDFRTMYLLVLAQIPLGPGSLRLGGGPVFYDYEGPSSLSAGLRTAGFSAGASVSREISSGLHLELGIRTGKAADNQSYLLGLQLVHYWGLADSPPGPGR